ncbi:hypothetical protein AVEN_21160-1, partial [Araneus ventricosus]
SDKTSNSYEVGIGPAFIALEGKRTNHYNGRSCTRGDRWFIKIFPVSILREWFPKRFARKCFRGQPEESEMATLPQPSLLSGKLLQTTKSPLVKLAASLLRQKQSSQTNLPRYQRKLVKKDLETLSSATVKCVTKVEPFAKVAERFARQQETRFSVRFPQAFITSLFQAFQKVFKSPHLADKIEPPSPLRSRTPT